MGDNQSTDATPSDTNRGIAQLWNFTCSTDTDTETASMTRRQSAPPPQMHRAKRAKRRPKTKRRHPCAHSNDTYYRPQLKNRYYREPPTRRMPLKLESLRISDHARTSWNGNQEDESDRCSIISNSSQTSYCSAATIISTIDDIRSRNSSVDVSEDTGTTPAMESNVSASSFLSTMSGTSSHIHMIKESMETINVSPQSLNYQLSDSPEPRPIDKWHDARLVKHSMSLSGFDRKKFVASDPFEYRHNLLRKRSSRRIRQTIASMSQTSSGSHSAWEEPGQCLVEKALCSLQSVVRMFPVNPQHICYFNDAVYDTDYAVCCSGNNEFASDTIKPGIMWNVVNCSFWGNLE